MYTEKEVGILKRGLAAGAQTLLLTGGESVEGTLFPVWQKTVHDILVERGCPCAQGQDGFCFLHLSTQVQQELFRHDDVLGLNAFCQVIEQGLVSLPDLPAN